MFCPVGQWTGFRHAISLSGQASLSRPILAGDGLVSVFTGLGIENVNPGFIVFHSKHECAKNDTVFLPLITDGWISQLLDSPGPWSKKYMKKKTF